MNLARIMIAALAFIFTMKVGMAYALDKVYSATVNEGELELEYLGSVTFDNQPDKNHLQSHELEVEYGLTSRIIVKAEAEFENEADQSVKLHGLGLGGRLQFFEQGEHWLDSGLLVSYEREMRSHEPDSLKALLLMEKQAGPFLHRANIGLKQKVGADAAGGPSRLLLWSSRYRHDVHFEPGFEIQSDFGKPHESLGFDGQEHYFGPAAYGQIVPNVKYEAAYLVGVSDAASAGAARVLLEYERFF